MPCASASPPPTHPGWLGLCKREEHCTPNSISSLAAESPGERPYRGGRRKEGRKGGEGRERQERRGRADQRGCKDWTAFISFLDDWDLGDGTQLCGNQVVFATKVILICEALALKGSQL